MCFPCNIFLSCDLYAEEDTKISSRYLIHSLFTFPVCLLVIISPIILIEYLLSCAGSVMTNETSYTLGSVPGI